MSNFTAIDFETATGDRASICQVGLVIVEQCKIVERIKCMVQPPGNIYHERNIAVHGIKPEDTEGAETFDLVYEKIKPYIAGKKLVAHNAQFDMSCLSKAIGHSEWVRLNAEWFCTKKIYGMSLKEAAAANGIIYTAHDALSDAEACALLMIKDILKG